MTDREIRIRGAKSDEARAVVMKLIGDYERDHLNDGRVPGPRGCVIWTLGRFTHSTVYVYHTKTAIVGVFQEAGNVLPDAPRRAPASPRRPLMAEQSPLTPEQRAEAIIPSSIFPEDAAVEMRACIAAVITEAVAAETERCAQIAMNPAAWNELPIGDDGQAIATAMRQTASKDSNPSEDGR